MDTALSELKELDQAGFGRQFEEVQEGVVALGEVVEFVPLPPPEGRPMVRDSRYSLGARMVGNCPVSLGSAENLRPRWEFHLLGRADSMHLPRPLVATEYDDRQSIAHR